jgi:uncharacterized protein (DUF305 family)
MSGRRLAGLRTRPGWQQLLVAVTLGALVGVVIGPVLLSVDPARDPGPRRGAPAASPAPWNSTDAAYVQAMLWHQQQARQLAGLVQGRTTRPELRRLAHSIRAAERLEVAQMTAWLRAHGAATSSEDVDLRPAEPAGRWFTGMMAKPQLQTLAATSGQRFDFLFVDMLLEHYQGAVVMADEVLADGRDAEVALLASRAIASSQRAIRQLTVWRRRWAEPFLRQLTPPAARPIPASA